MSRFGYWLFLDCAGQGPREQSVPLVHLLLSRTCGLGGTHGNVTVYGLWGAGILGLHIITSMWNGGGAVALLICRTTISWDSRYIGYGVQDRMGGNRDSTSL